MVSILGLGDNVVDRFLDRRRMYPGGQAMNIAVYAHMLGVPSGYMMGCFLFGGSDIVMLFQKGVQFELTAPKTNDGSYAHIQMGQEYGIMKNKIE